VIVNGSSNRCAGWWGSHLESDENDSVRLVKSWGLRSNTIPGMLQEMMDLTVGTNCRNGFYQINMNPAPGEVFTEDKLERARQIVEQRHGLEGQAYFIVVHVKNGREHPHLVYSRIRLETMTAISDSHGAHKNHAIARQIEREFGWRKVTGPLDHAPETPRPKRAPKPWEMRRDKKHGLDTRDIAAEVTRLCQQSETGKAFEAALEAHGYQLVTGNRGLLILDRAGDEHSLARRLHIPMKQVLNFMRHLDLKALPTVEQGKAQHRARKAVLEAGCATHHQAAPTLRQPQQAPQPIARTAPTSDQIAEAAIDREASIAEITITFPDPLAPPNPGPAIPVQAHDGQAEAQTDCSPFFAVAAAWPEQNHRERQTRDEPPLMPEDRMPQDRPASADSGRKHDAIGPPPRLFSPGAIKQLWRKARQALTDPEAGEPKPKARRRGESEGDFRRLGRMLGRSFNARRSFRKVALKRLHRRLIIRLTREAWGPPDAHLITTPIANSESDCGKGFEAGITRNSHGNNYLSPGP
jgi:hypothetical protein